MLENIATWLELVKEGGALASLTLVTCYALYLAHRQRGGD